MPNNVSREQIFVNLFNLLSGAVLPSPLPPSWRLTGRRLLAWDDVLPASQPTMFLHQGPQAVSAQTFPLNQWKMYAQVWIYFRTDSSLDQNIPGDTLVNGILDAIDKVLEVRSPWMGMRQDLDGVVYHCAISGTVGFDTGIIDKSGQGVIVIPLEITTGQ